MSKKDNQAIYPKVTCDRCGAQAVGPSGMRHRRCGGGEGAPPRAKREKGPTANRGTWRG